ncbi:SDR family oxidoreductase [Roseibium aestuarii]|uniref:SDR family oxidoreductase n=1 Tax=Roseibium aestuarii TaxID=2600299 RepID=A0ABW4JYJ5_9HYPH|nr:SDR family oxidoreductase [Roseibium aestuarii]
MSDLQSKTVFITGASRGIGEAAARVFAERGANVVLTARSTGDITRIASEITSAGGQALAISLDVTDAAAVQAAIRQTVDRFGALDVVINNAGVIDPIARLEDADPAAWGKVIDINVKGVLNVIRHAIAPMKAHGGGTIINISSGAATGALEGWSHYCASKAAVLSLTKCAHLELIDDHIRVLGLSPGTVATDMQVAIKASGINPVSQLDPNVHIPARWVGEALAWLSGPAGDRYVGIDCSLRDEGVRRAVGLIA